MNCEIIKSFFPFIENENDYIATPIVSGHINTTYVLEIKSLSEKFILQKINTNVFKSPEALMNNIRLVTEFMAKKGVKTLNFIKANDGKLFSEANGDFWRVCNFLENSINLSELETDKAVYEKAGLALGDFQKALLDFDAEKLCEIIPDFHNTKKRYKDFENSVSQNASGRAADCTAEIAFVQNYSFLSQIIQNKIEDGTIPVRVTHNDTKLSNIMADKDTKDVICLIDLDTIMPGSILYDFGDALRTAASTAAEDEADLAKVHFSKENYDGFEKGYLSAYGDFISENEKKLLLYSVAVMTYECGMRFLADYINGDIYFHTDYNEHNLVRARNQFKLVEEICALIKEEK